MIALWPLWLAILLGMIVTATGITITYRTMRRLDDIGPFLDELGDIREDSDHE